MTNQEKVHWMISGLLVLGAWLSALFFLGVTYLFGGFSVDPLYLGGLFIIVAAGLAGYGRRLEVPAAAVFLSQLELAFSLCGKTLFCIAIMFRWRLGAGGEFAVLAVMAALSYPVFRQQADRAITVCAALCMGIAWPVLVTSFPSVLLETCTVVLFMGAYVLFVLEKEAGRPLAWALLGACLFSASICLSETSSMYWLSTDETVLFSPIINSLLLGAALGAVYVWRGKELANGWIVVLLLLLSVLSNSGTLMGFALLALGCVQKRLSLKIIGAVVMYTSLIWLYYNMQSTLLLKAGYLCAAGGVLLGAYAWLKRGNKDEK